MQLAMTVGAEDVTLRQFGDQSLHTPTAALSNVEILLFWVSMMEVQTRWMILIAVKTLCSFLDLGDVLADFLSVITIALTLNLAVVVAPCLLVFPIEIGILAHTAYMQELCAKLVSITHAQ